MNDLNRAPLVPITELLSFIVDNRGKVCPTVENGFPLIATNCIKHSSIYPTFENIRFVSKDTLENWFRAELKPNDILFVNKGTPGRVCLVPNPVNFCVAQDTIGLRVNEKVYYKYLFAILRSDYIQNIIANYHVGIAIPHFKKSDLSSLLIPLPDMQLQKKIGNLYCGLSEIIENNNHIISELESLAKTIYDYWFLQFEFPNEDGKPYKSSGGKMVWNEELKREIPEGWEVERFGNLASFTKGKIPTEPLAEKPDGDTTSPYVTIDVANGASPMYCNPTKMISLNGETIMVMDGAASGDVYVGNFGILGSTFSKITSERNDISNSLIYMMLKEHSAIYKKANTGSTVPHANAKFINQLKFPISKNNSYFSKKLDVIFNQIKVCKDQNQELASLRDFLLPMLMNGQVTFKD